MPGVQPPKRILVVDDDKEVREALKKILEKEALQVEVAQNGAEAVALAKSTPFDLVVTDLVMPEMDGIELFMELKKEAPDVRVIIITAYGNWDSYLDAMNSGAVNYVTKPLKKDELVKLVRNALALTPGKPANGLPATSDGLREQPVGDSITRDKATR